LNPENKYIKIDKNIERIEKFIKELILEPRINALKWSKITKQTPNMKIGYPGQHLASLITGVEGVRTGARGDDLEDGTEIKSCSRVDQLDNCKDCGQKVLRIEDSCPHCGSKNINRMNDSKWLFSIKSEEELKLLTEKINRIFLTIADYPYYEDNNFETIRIQAFEIWNTDERHKNFKTLMTNYYYKIFLRHIKKNPKKTPAPKNFWPYSYQFYLCNPIKIFEVFIEKANNNPVIKINTYIEPNQDRSSLIATPMPILLLKKEELEVLIKHQDLIEPQISKGYTFNDFKNLVLSKKINKDKLIKILPFINQESRMILPLRDTDKISTSKKKYQRR